jgi:hypothetical protein
MKNLGLAVMTLLFTNFVFGNELGVEDAQSDKVFKKIPNKAFKPGEKLVYRLSYGIFDAGEAVLTVDQTDKMVRGRKIWRVRGIGKTISAFEWFYKVNDRYESYIDAEGLFPWMFVRRVNEGGYIINQDYTFYQHQNKVDNGEGKDFNVPDLVQDMISSFYFARTLDYDKAKIGDQFLVNIFLDDELYPTKIKYLGKEVIKTRNGKFRCHKFAPVVQEGRVFNSEEDLTVWITDDGNKIPIMAKANLKVGSMKMHLVDWQGLANEMAKVD